MDAHAGLVAGSFNNNQLVFLGPESLAPRSAEGLSGRVCQICGDNVGITPNGDLFVACNECAFPVCRPCYEYERKDGNQACPQCKTRYKRHQGSPRVVGDEEEEGAEDLENEFNYVGCTKHPVDASLLQSTVSYAHANELSNNPYLRPVSMIPQVPLLIDSRNVSEECARTPSDRHSLDVAPDNVKRALESRSMDLSREFSPYEFGDVAWKERIDSWKTKQEKMQMTMTEGGYGGDGGDLDNGGPNGDVPVADDGKRPLSRIVPIPASKLNPYRIVILIRLLILAFFLRFRILNPVSGAYGLWLTSVICEVWFAVSWILDQFPKWLPINRETYLDRLSLRFEPAGHPPKLAAVDVYVSTVDPLKEPPLVTANTVLSILSVDYPVDKVSCYVSDDGAAMLTFETLSETAEFARKWVPFCKKFSIEPRAPEMYFAQKIDYLKDKIQPTFVKERRAMKRVYEEFKIKINSLVAKAHKVPDEGWTMQDGTLWPGNNTRDHPGMIQVFLGHNGGHDIEGNELPRLVYVSREKRPGFNHHKKAGAMNALVRVSAVLTNAPYFLNLDCDHYINNSKALREAMCFMMDSGLGKDICYVQFPQRFDGIDLHDRYANHNTVFFDINLKGLDGVQGPVYVGTGCVFRRQALYGIDAPVSESAPKEDFITRFCCGPRKKSDPTKQKRSERSAMTRSDSSVPMFSLEDIEEGRDGYNDDNRSLILSRKDNEKKFGQSSIFLASTFHEEGGVTPSVSSGTLLQEAIHVISCGYEDKTEWGKEIGWIYGSVTEDILTGFKMHCRGWRSVYCMPLRPAFKGSAPINLSDRLHQVLRWALGSVEILFSKHCPLWYAYGGRLKWLQRLAYVNTIVYPLTSLPLLAYCTLPAVCLLTGKFIIPSISNYASLWFISLFLSIFITCILEIRWSGVGIDDWWRNEQFWVIGGVSAHLFAVFQGLLKVLAGIDTNFTVTAKGGDSDSEFEELYIFKWTSLLVPPTALIVINLVGIVAGVSDALNSGYQAWGPLFGKLFFAFWVIVHLYPFLKGLMGRQNRTPTIVIVWSILLASIFSLLWVRIDPFLSQTTTTGSSHCGQNC